MVEIDLTKLFEVEHDDNFAMTPEQVKINLQRKLTRWELEYKLRNLEKREEEA